MQTAEIKIQLMQKRDFGQFGGEAIKGPPQLTLPKR